MRHKYISLMVLLVPITLCAIFAVGRAEQHGRADMVVAYVSNILLEIDSKDAVAALKVWVRELAKDIGHTSDSYVADNPQKIADDLQRGLVDIAGLSTVDYLRFGNKINADVAFGYVRGGKSTQTYLLLTKNGYGNQKVADLKNRKIAVLKNDQTSLLFLNTLLLRNNLPEAASFFSEVQEKTRPSQMILAVFFGQLDACVATEYSLATIAELNPQVKKGVTVVASSPTLVDKVLVIRKDYRDDYKRKVIATCHELRGTSRGKQLLNLFKMDDVVPASEISLDSMKNLLAEYDRLKTRQVKHVTRGG